MHAELFYCPYCDEEDLYPDVGDAWQCTTCLRSFSVTHTARRAPHTRHRDQQPDAASRSVAR